MTADDHRIGFPDGGPSGTGDVVISIDAMSGDRERYLALGMTDYVSKPLDQRELTHKIALAMGERQLLADVAA